MHGEVMQSPPSICQSVCFHSEFRIDRHLALIFRMCVGHQLATTAHGGLKPKVTVKVKTWSVWPQSSIEDGFQSFSFHSVRVSSGGGMSLANLESFVTCAQEGGIVRVKLSEVDVMGVQLCGSVTTLLADVLSQSSLLVDKLENRTVHLASMGPERAALSERLVTPVTAIWTNSYYNMHHQITLITRLF